MANPHHCSEVEIFEHIGSGAFGKIYKGSLNGTTVAIKITKDGNNEAKKEIRRMKHLDHENVLKLLATVPPHMHYGNGCCSFSHTTWIITEFMSRGSLLEYIMNYVGGLPSHGMIQMAFQVAYGMDYLHRCMNIVHRDLAARNVLVKDDNFNVKIGDFGLSNEYSYGDSYYEDEEQRPFPVRWMPPENMPVNGRIGKFSRKGDVWSYGVLLFEIWSRAELPFDGLSNVEVMHAVIDGDNVLGHFDVKAKKWVLELMEDCFQYEKAERPNFRQIYETIEDYF